jgi:hypothetical protein
MIDNVVFTDALELHYIDMKSFVKMVNGTSSNIKSETYDSMLAKWLVVITEKDIVDKTIIKSICEEQEEIGMAVSALARMSKDKIKRQAYQRRQDDILLYNKRMSDFMHMAEQEKKRAEQAEKRAEQAEKMATQEKKKAEKMIEQEKKSAEVALEEKDAIIAKLKARLDEK